MRIVLDARMIQESGIGRYIRNLLEQLQALDEKNEYFFILTKKDYDHLKFKGNFKKILANFKWYGVSEQLRIPKILHDLKPDLVHFPHFNVPLFYDGKFVVTIHDLIHHHFQMRRATTLNPITYKIKQLAYNAIFKNAINKSLKILVPSNYVKKLLVDEWKVKEDKVSITYEAVDDKIISLTKNLKLKIENTLEKFNIKPPYLFYVGNAHPHKNVAGLIKAFLLLQKKYPNLNLVLSGHDHYFWERVKKQNKYSGIFYTGFINDEELVALYKNAESFVMPSFEEGFGIPLLEAMACGCSVISSNSGSLPEIAGDAALYFDPEDEGDMVEKISQVLNNESLRKSLIEKGKMRAKDFSWKKLGEQTLEVYQKCV